ncbi:MAG: hypothetical protein WDO69_35605 [Pseudomonadota bacterium]
MPQAINERGLGFRLLGSLIGAGLALALAVAAAHYYTPPDLNGASHSNSWLERDFCFAAASGLVAAFVGLHAGVAQVRALGAVLVRALIWFGLTMLLVAAWGNSVSLLTLLIAPSHAFACLRLATLVRAWRSERLWRK